jgi:hypothetical protein
VQARPSQLAPTPHCTKKEPMPGRFSTGLRNL